MLSCAPNNGGDFRVGKSVSVEQQKTARCVTVADEVLAIFSKHGFDVIDGMFTSMHLVARHLQRIDIAERDVMADTIAKEIFSQALGIDKAIFNTKEGFKAA
jgi:hypothetical protein